MNSKIYVGNLSYDIENSDLENLFGSIGKVLTVNVIKDRETGRARGFGFIEMESSDEANIAVEQLGLHLDMLLWFQFHKQVPRPRMLFHL